MRAYEIDVLKEVTWITTVVVHVPDAENKDYALLQAESLVKNSPRDFTWDTMGENIIALDTET